MTEVVAHFTNNGVPLVGPGNVPTIRIRRTDTQALVVTDSDMTEIGDGNYSFTFVPSATLEYTIRADGDPTDSGQTTAGERYMFGSLSGVEEARIKTDIPQILTDVGNLSTDVGNLNDLSEADVQSALDSQGYTAARAALLDNLDAAVSGLVSDVLASVIDASGSPTVTVELALQRIHAFVASRIVVAGNQYTYRDAGDTSNLYTITDNDPVDRQTSI